MENSFSDSFSYSLALSLSFSIEQFIEHLCTHMMATSVVACNSGVRRNRLKTVEKGEAKEPDGRAKDDALKSRDDCSCAEMR